MTSHRDLTSANAHVIGYVSSSDPGAVGAGKAWIDTSGGESRNSQLKIRNAANTDWNWIPGRLIYFMSRITADASATELLSGGAGGTRLIIPNDTTWLAEIYIVARRTDADNESAGYIRRCVIDNNANTVALVGSVTSVYTNEDTAAWDVTVDADNTNKALRIRGTGEGGKTIQWVARVILTQATG